MEDLETQNKNIYFLTVKALNGSQTIRKTIKKWKNHSKMRRKVILQRINSLKNYFKIIFYLQEIVLHKFLIK